MHASTLHRLFPTAKFDEPLKRYTAWKIGGPADALLEPQDADELIATVEKAREHDISVTVLGGGTNVLVRDGGIRGLTIRLAKSLTRVEIEGPHASAEAGVLYPVLANATAGRGLKGLEFATGIPGTVGGAVYMNAGAYDGETKDVLLWADVYRDGDYVEAVEYLQSEKGIRVEVMSAAQCTSQALLDVCDLHTDLADIPDLFRRPGPPKAISDHHSAIS